MSAREVLATTIGEFYVGSHHAQRADAIIAALSAAGYVIVPAQATGDMLVAGGNAQQTSIGSWGEPEVVYRAMLAAAIQAGGTE